jgi:putative spermidine/putrescine transport system ATP-binding protein
VEGDRCTVRLGDDTQVTALHVKPIGPGRPTTLSIRPERLFIGTAPEAAANRIRGTVVDTIYLGDHVRVGMHAAGNPDIMIKLPGKPETRPLPGDQLELSFRAEDCRALDPLWHPPAAA